METIIPPGLLLSPPSSFLPPLHTLLQGRRWLLTCALAFLSITRLTLVPTVSGLLLMKGGCDSSLVLPSSRRCCRHCKHEVMKREPADFTSFQGSCPQRWGYCEIPAKGRWFQSPRPTRSLILNDFFSFLFASHTKSIFVLCCSGNLVLYSFTSKSFWVSGNRRQIKLSVSFCQAFILPLQLERVLNSQDTVNRIQQSVW